MILCTISDKDFIGSYMSSFISIVDVFCPIEFDEQFC